jgi:hypothetical protein
MIIQKGIKHVAVSWLKPGVDPEKIKQLAAGLAEIPQVAELVIGGPVDHDWAALKVDKSWDFGMVVSFRTVDDCRDYFNDERHQRIAGEMRDNAERVFALYLDY